MSVGKMGIKSSDTGLQSFRTYFKDRTNLVAFYELKSQDLFYPDSYNIRLKKL